MAARELEQEQAKQVACDAGDFDKAAAILHTQEQLEREHAQEIWAILSVLARDAFIGDLGELTGPTSAD